MRVRLVDANTDAVTDLSSSVAGIESRLEEVIALLTLPQDLHTQAFPEFTGLKLNGLTASRFVSTNESKQLCSTDVNVTPAALEELCGGEQTTLHSHVRFVNRGDPAVWDWVETGSKTVLNTDGQWHDLDLSNIIPTNAANKLIAIRYYVSAANVGSFVKVRKNGHAEIQNADATTVSVSSVPVRGTFLVECDANRVIEYQASNIAFQSISLAVGGWFV